MQRWGEVCEEVGWSVCEVREEVGWSVSKVCAEVGWSVCEEHVIYIITNLHRQYSLNTLAYISYG